MRYLRWPSFPALVISLPLHISGLHGGNRVCQVHQADHAGRDHPLQQERLDHRQERLHVPRVQDRWPQVREGALDTPLQFCAQRVLVVSSSSCSMQNSITEHYLVWGGHQQTIPLCNQNNPIWSNVAAVRHAVLLIVCPLLWAHLFFAGMIKFFENPSDISPASRRGNILEAATSNHRPFIALSQHSTYRKFSLLSPDNVLQLKEPFSQYFRDF